ncbi:MAG: NADH-quinone oxidoreductase subunit K [Verrucomicrobia bacterium]|nr:NADH-quinone oxidoreductase subunit K [Verrucomicrobiota bacterium]MCH8511140.1 NADH-quinone oxidoreductase subunit K [Kiritimatiellia bacterium]
MPSPALIYALAGIWITVIGLRSVLVEEDFFRKIIASNILGSGVFLVLVAMARRNPDLNVPPDPVPHGMILTGIVVAVSATALMLALLGHLNDLEKNKHQSQEDDT